MAHHLLPTIARLRYALLGLLILFTTACGLQDLRNFINPGGGNGTPALATATPTGGKTAMTATPTPVPMRLSQGEAQPQPTAPVTRSGQQPLTEAETAAVLGRLPTLPALPGEQTQFKLPTELLPPPRPGETVKVAFPAAPDAPQPTLPAAAALQVLRYAPEGEISIAPFVSVTFDQPMVPLATLADLKSAEVPVRLEPPLEGVWRWVGTKTLTFQYDSKLIDRLPKATNYRATIPAGARSAVGGVLAKVVEWTFSTPPPKMVSSYPPNSPQPANPLFFMAFDQRIDPAAVLKTIQVKAGNKIVAVQLVDAAEALAHDQVKYMAKNTLDGRWLAFKAAALPLDTAVTVTAGPGTPSAEGPLTTKTAQTYSFRTYAPLKITEHGCGWSDAVCRPLMPFYIRFNNALDPKAFQESQINISPPLPGAVVSVSGTNINIQGSTKGQTTYTLTVAGGLQDIFGQTLGREERLTFKVGSADPLLQGPNQPFVTVDPVVSKPAFSVYVINYSRLDVQIYAEQPSDWPAFQNYLRNYRNTQANVKIPGRQVFNKTITVEAATDTLTEAAIDLSQVMDGQSGQFVVVVTPTRGLLTDPKTLPVVQSWVQVTRIGLDAFVDHSEMVAWATSLLDGKPAAGAVIEAGPSGASFTASADGLARFAIPNGTSYLTARQGADLALLPRSPSAYDTSTWQVRPIKDTLKWYVFDDRKIYRPGEEVHLKGWLRRVGGKQDGDVSLPGRAVTGVRYRLTEPNGTEIGSGQLPVSALGGFDFAVKLPEKMNLGSVQVNFNAEGSLENLASGSYNHSFQVQEFRRPEFEVTARNESPGPYFAGRSGVVAVEAKYYAGGALPDAEVTWQVTSAPGSYSPPNWPDFSFGSWTPWWFSSQVARGGPSGGTRTLTYSGRTDTTGNHYLNIDFPAGDVRPISISARATVMDVNRQAWTGSTSLLVHPAELYVGMRSERYFVERGTPLKIDLIVTDLDGKPVSDRPIDVRAARLEWKYRSGSWIEEEADVQNCRPGSSDKPVTCTFQTPQGGTYLITAAVTDSQGRTNQSSLTRWVSGGKIPAARKVEQEKVTLIPDKETYQPGDTAQILVQPPFSPAEGLLKVTRSGLLTTQSFKIEKDQSFTLKIPVAEKDVPNLNIQVDLTGSAPRQSDSGEPLPNVAPRPAYASGQLTIKIPPLQRTLSLKVTPEKPELEPGKATAVGVSLRDASGKPVAGAEVAVVVVDEAVLALTGYKLTDPISLFYTNRSADLASHYSRANIVLLDPQLLSQLAAQQDASKALGGMPQGTMSPMAPPMPSMAMRSEASAAAPGEAEQKPIDVRTNFNPLAAFAPAVRTDASGEARVELKLPDNLTRYRVMAVAVEGGSRFGTGESNLTARLPLMVRPSAPRFLNFGDRFELPVVVQNQTAATLTVDVVLRATNLKLTASPGYRVTVPARNRVEVRFPAAADMAGTARFQAAAVSGEYADAAVVELPVYTPATTEAFATYGVVDQGAIAQPVLAPKGVFPQFGSLEIDTSSTALHSLTDAVLYLVSYPYECSEQLSSRILGVAALRDVLTAFQAKGLPSAKDMEAAVGRDITRLQGMQNSDGGMPYWQRGKESIPFNTIHAAHALQRAKAKGFTVPPAVQQRLLEYLKNIEGKYPSWYSARTKQNLSAYALYVRLLMGDRDPDKALRQINEAGLEKLDLDAIGWLWQVIKDSPAAANQLTAIRRLVNNRAVETAGAANFTTSYDEQSYLLLNSDRRTDGILLDALMADNPQSDLIPKLVNGLLAHKKQGRWLNTQENVFVLLALDRYFNTYEAQTPNFVARIWLGSTYAGSHEYRGRTTERDETNIPMSYLLDTTAGGISNLILSKDGAGRLYYRLGLTYAPLDLVQKPLDMGFVVTRIYEAVDNPADVRRDSDGVWHIKAGAKVRIRVTMVADNRRYHVALSDPLPAGLEILNPALAVTGSVPQDPGNTRYGWWWSRSWYEHQNLRDERAEAFTSLLWDGVYTYEYTARATTLGRFVVPPTKAEEMYSPEVFGRSASDVVVVE